MRKLYSSALCLMAATAISAGAQQLPNVGFNDWKTACGSSEGFGKGGTTSPAAGEMRQRPGVEPEGWNGSSVNQKVILEKKEELVSRVEENGNAAVQLQNKFVGVMGIGSVAPGFITLGTPWVYAESTISNCDGGVYGGIDFTSTPDAIAANCKRTDETGENSHLIAYLWSGTYESLVGPKNAPAQTRQDVTAAIMCKADESIVSAKGTLVAQTDFTFTTTNGEWQTLVAELDYLTDASPEKANVVVSSGEFWDRGALKENTTLLTDDVRFVYYSRLSEITCDGETIKLDDINAPMSNEGVAEVAIPYEFDALTSLTTLGRSATKLTPANLTTTTRADGGIDATAVVTNIGEDLDGRTSHTYIFHFAAPEVKGTDYAGYLTIVMAGETLADDQEATITVTPNSDDRCTVTLPNFSLALDGGDPVPLGDIVVPDVKIEKADNATRYTGSVKDMQLLGGEIVADVTLDGTIDAEGNVLMKIQVLWMEIPIDVTFSTSNKAGACVITADDNQTAEYYSISGMRLNSSNLTPGTIVIVRTGSKTQKIIVK